MRITKIIALLLIGVLLTLSACTKPYTPTSTLEQGANEVWVPGREFSPWRITVPVGTKVTWTSKDSEMHTVASTGLFRGILYPDGSFSYTFTENGTFSYYCEIHAGEMGGVVVVVVE